MSEPVGIAPDNDCLAADEKKQKPTQHVYARNAANLRLKCPDGAWLYQRAISYNANLILCFAMYCVRRVDRMNPNDVV